MSGPFAAAVLALGCAAAMPAQNPGAGAIPTTLIQVKRVYVAPLGDGPGSQALRALIISSLNATRLFILTDNKARADAILKGAAADHTYIETHDLIDGANGRGGINLSSGRSTYSRTGISANEGGSDREAYHSKELKHDAFAAVRLCNREGDVIWSTTQESGGGKFQGASEEVAAKVARQMREDFQREHEAASPHP